MTKTQTEAKRRWADNSHHAKARWNRLTDEDIEDVRGNVERLVDALRARYGYARRFAERDIANWSRSLAEAEAKVQQN
ncbi:MAG: hypothetical protein U0Q12_13745 [Vicinamibacterales bacterium]